MSPPTNPLQWLHAFDLRRAQHVIDVPGGVALLHDDFPLVYDHNKLSLVAEAEASDVAEAAATVLGGAGREHRQIQVLDADAPAALAEGLAAAGYTCEEQLVMIYGGAPARLRPDVDVHRLSLDERVAAGSSSWEDELPDAGPEAWRQLGERVTTAEAAASATFLGVTDGDGKVLARGDVFIFDGVAEIDDVFTDPAARGRGYASAIVATAVEQAQRAGAGTIFLVAEADDWPRHLYTHLGFRDSSTIRVFDRDA